MIMLPGNQGLAYSPHENGLVGHRSLKGSQLGQRGLMIRTPLYSVSHRPFGTKTYNAVRTCRDNIFEFVDRHNTVNQILLALV